jgi:hypothetical protein
MDICGNDIIVEGVPPSKEAMLEVVRGFWPDMVVEDDEAEDFFVYKDQRAKDIWDGVGLTDDNDADMIYFLPRENGLTMVIDTAKTLMYITDEVKNLMRR